MDALKRSIEAGEGKTKPAKGGKRAPAEAALQEAQEAG